MTEMYDENRIAQEAPELFMAAVDMARDQEPIKQHARKGHALTQREAELVLKVKDILDAAMRPKFQETADGLFVAVIDDEVKAAAVNMCAGEKPPLNWRRALKIANRVLSGDWFCLAHTAIESDYGQMSIDDLTYTGCAVDVPLFMLSILRTSRGVNDIIIPEKYPAFYTAADLADKRKALGLTNRFKYIGLQELAAVKTIQAVCRGIDEVSESSTHYVQMPSAPISNTLAHMSSRALKNKTRSLDGEIVIETGEAEISYSGQLEDVIALGNPNAAKMLQQANITLHSLGYRGQSVVITKEAFIEARGLKDTKEARNQMQTAAKSLSALNIKASWGKNGKDGFYRAPLFQRTAYVDGIGVEFVYSDDYFKYQSRHAGQVMQYHKGLQKLPNRGSAFAIANKFQEHKRTNIGKPGNIENRLSVLTIIENCGIPSFDEIKLKRQAKDLIIKPLVDALDRIEEAGVFSWNWSYSAQSGKPGVLSEEDLLRAETEYAFFSTLVVEVKWFDEPDYTNLLENKAKQKAKADAPKRGRGRPRKEPKE